MTVENNIVSDAPEGGIQTPPAQPEPAAPEGAAPVAPEPAKPHPLQPGGVRFEEVYGKWKTAEGRLAELERQLEEAKAAKTPDSPAAAPVLTVDQIQAALDGGQITVAQALSYAAYQAKEQATTAALAALETRQRTQTVTQEVAQYTDRLPALRDPTSDDYRRVSAAATEIAAEMGRPVRDPVVLRRAMRETLGPVEKLGAKARVAEQDRQRSDPGGVLLPGSGGASPRDPAAAPRDPMAIIQRVDPNQWAFWERYGVPMADRKAEAPYIEAKLRRRGRWPA